jgi:uncharacterized protein
MTAFVTNRAPGVYVQEKPATGPIAGVGTSVAAFIGTPVTMPEGADATAPFAVANWTAYSGRFGDDLTRDRPLPHALRGFFANGGTLAHVVPVGDASDGEQVGAALEALTRVLDVNLVCLPGVVDTGVQREVLRHCEEHNRFAVLDGAVDPDPLQAGPLREQRADLESAAGFGALYWPWMSVDDPDGPRGTTIDVPPSGHVAGIMARSDALYGVHKAPANELVRGIRGLGYSVNATEHGQLNELNVNVIRRFPGRPPLLYGARTLTRDTPWRYVNVRRLVSYVESSLLEGLRWSVFQPNNTALWKALERTITEFLTRIWLSGALFGRTAAEAFYVRIDEELNPEGTRAVGMVVIEIGLAPVRPAEFVLLQLGLWDGGAQLSES